MIYNFYLLWKSHGNKTVHIFKIKQKCILHFEHFILETFTPWYFTTFSLVGKDWKTSFRKRTVHKQSVNKLLGFILRYCDKEWYNRYKYYAQLWKTWNKN